MSQAAGITGTPPPFLGGSSEGIVSPRRSLHRVQGLFSSVPVVGSPSHLRRRLPSSSRRRRFSSFPSSASPPSGRPVGTGSLGAVGAVFVDLDRTLLRQASGPRAARGRSRPRASRADRAIPGDRLLYLVYDRLGENLFSMGLARATRPVGQGLVAVGGPPGGDRGGRCRAGRAGGAVRAGRAGRPPGGRAPARAGHHDARRPGDPARPRPSVSTTSSPPIRGGRRPLHGPARGRLRLGARQVPGGPPLGRGRTGWTSRPATPTRDSVFDVPCSRASASRTRSTRTCASPRSPSPGAGRSSTGTARRACRRSAGSSPTTWSARSSRRPRSPTPRFDISGLEHIPARGPVILVCQPPQLLRRRRRSPSSRRASAGRSASSASRRSSTRRCSAGWRGRSAASRSTGAAARPRRCVEAEAALRAGEVVVVLPQGTIPRGEAFFDPVLHGKTGHGAPRRVDRRPVVPIGLSGTEAGLAAFGQAARHDHARLPATVTVARRVAGRARRTATRSPTRRRSWRPSPRCCPPAHTARTDRRGTGQDPFPTVTVRAASGRACAAARRCACRGGGAHRATALSRAARRAERDGASAGASDWSSTRTCSSPPRRRAGPVALVSGTNGKTTTTRLLATALETRDRRRGRHQRHRGQHAGRPRRGAGRHRPPRSGRPRGRRELPAGWCSGGREPAVVVLLNLSRDQLDRTQRGADAGRPLARGAGRDSGEAGTAVVANADDPLVAWAAGQRRRVVWVAARARLARRRGRVPVLRRSGSTSRRRRVGVLGGCDLRVRPTGARRRLEGGRRTRSPLRRRPAARRSILGLPGRFNRANAAHGRRRGRGHGRARREHGAGRAWRRSTEVAGRFSIRRLGGVPDAPHAGQEPGRLGGAPRAHRRGAPRRSWSASTRASPTAGTRPGCGTCRSSGWPAGRWSPPASGASTSSVRLHYAEVAPRGGGRPAGRVDPARPAATDAATARVDFARQLHRVLRARRRL